MSFPKNEFTTKIKESSISYDPKEEAKQMIREWCSQMKKKYGDNWKETVAKEMTESMINNPTMKQILSRDVLP